MCALTSFPMLPLDQGWIAPRALHTLLHSCGASFTWPKIVSELEWEWLCGTECYYLRCGRRIRRRRDRVFLVWERARAWGSLITVIFCITDEKINKYNFFTFERRSGWEEGGHSMENNVETAWLGARWGENPWLERRVQVSASGTEATCHSRYLDGLMVGTLLSCSRSLSVCVLV